MLNQKLVDIIKVVAKTVFGIEVKNEDINLSTPPNIEMGDCALGCFLFAKQLKKSPTEIAKLIAENISVNDIIVSVEATGPYVNFKFSRQAIFSDLNEFVDESGVKFKKDKGKRIMVEFLSPNTNKPLHLGHVRNGVIGTSISLILKAIGHNVINTNLVNDRGVHICKSMLAWQLFSNGETPESIGMKSDHFVGKYYVLFNQEAQKDPNLNDEVQKMLLKWEQKDPEIRFLWKKMNKWVYDGFEETYKKLGLQFDIFYYESDTYKLGKDIIQQGLNKGVFQKEDNGSIVFPLPESFGLNKDGSPRKVTVLRKDGTSVYMTQDVGTAVKKFADENLQSSIYVVGSEQKYHFECLFAILKALGYNWAEQCLHRSYGMVHLPDGKMKSREGTVVDADNLVADVKALAVKSLRARHSNDGVSEEDLDNRASKIAIGAIKFYLLRVGSDQEIRFNPKESISFEGFTGPYCQYSYARAMKILRDAGELSNKVDFSSLGSNEELILAQKIKELPISVKKSAESLNPSLVALHVFEMAKAFNQFYHLNPILKDGVANDLRNERLALTQIFARAMKQGLSLLGIEIMEEM